ncbi:hypothetical protein C8F01DRAFT_283993 [Mycena amicta]|nr:hypothetical protein C8F01DRAFT_283993 [Mycena amicta]
MWLCSSTKTQKHLLRWPETNMVVWRTSPRARAGSCECAARGLEGKEYRTTYVLLRCFANRNEFDSFSAATDVRFNTLSGSLRVWRMSMVEGRIPSIRFLTTSFIWGRCGHFAAPSSPPPSSPPPIVSSPIPALTTTLGAFVALATRMYKHVPLSRSASPMRISGPSLAHTIRVPPPTSHSRLIALSARCLKLAAGRHRSSTLSQSHSLRIFRAGFSAPLKSSVAFQCYSRWSTVHCPRMDFYRSRERWKGADEVFPEPDDVDTCPTPMSQALPLRVRGTSFRPPFRRAA